jgi:hypothetical protein
MPPVSVTIHPRNLPAVVPDAVLLVLDELGDEVVVDPHAAVTKAATARTAPIRMDCLTAYLLFPGRL